MSDDLWQRLAAAPDRANAASSDYDLNTLATRPERSLKEAAVLIGVDPDGQLLLTRRAAHLKHHPGQIALPGGRRDADDADAVATALREAHEEVALPSADIIGQMAPHETISGYSITPVIARIPDFTPIPEPGEVGEIFRVPMIAISDPDRFRIETRYWSGRPWRYYTVPYGPYYIWGATARVLFQLSEAMR